jgi:hypothetical protein
MQIRHWTAISDNSYGLDAVSNQANFPGNGPQFAANADIRDNILTTSGNACVGNSELGQGTVAQKFWFDQTSSNEAYNVCTAPASTASSYTEFQNNAAYPITGCAIANGCVPPNTWYLETSGSGALTPATIDFQNSSANSGALTLPDYHGYELASGSPFAQGASTVVNISGPASDGTSMGANIPAIDAAMMLNQYPGLFPEVPVNVSCTSSVIPLAGVEMFCVNPYIGKTILCGTTNNTVPTTNGSTSPTTLACTNGFQLQQIPQSGGSLAYFNVSQSGTVNVVLGVSGQTDFPEATYSISVPAQTVTPQSFGFQCGTGVTTNCPGPAWPTTSATPYLLRGWDMQMQWKALNTASGTYSWTGLDNWLLLLQAHPGVHFMYTMGWTPCWATTGTCTTNGSAAPPSDLGLGTGTCSSPAGGGSPNFCAFITALAQHCVASAPTVCFANYATDIEQWNEANSTSYWSGTTLQLYQMMAPAIAIIRQYMPNVIVHTPPLSNANNGGTGCQVGFNSWMTCYLGYEDQYGILSQVYNFHRYLADNLPESATVLTGGTSVAALMAPNTGTSGWSPLVTWNTELNYNTSTYQCNTTDYSILSDCVGQAVRYQIILNSLGVGDLTWYYWNTAIGTGGQLANPSYQTAYLLQQTYMLGAHYTASAALISGTTWSAPLIEGNGNAAEWVWQTCVSGGTYTSCVNTGTPYIVPSGYSDYRDLSGGTTIVTPGETITVTSSPILLEQALAAPTWGQPAILF